MKKSSSSEKIKLLIRYDVAHHASTKRRRCYSASLTEQVCSRCDKDVSHWNDHYSFSYNETGPSAVIALSRPFILQQPVCLAFLMHVDVLDTVIQTCHIEAGPCDFHRLVRTITIHFVPYLRHSPMIPPSVTADGQP